MDVVNIRNGPISLETTYKAVMAGPGILKQVAPAERLALPMVDPMSRTIKLTRDLDELELTHRWRCYRAPIRHKPIEGEG